MPGSRGEPSATVPWLRAARAVAHRQSRIPAVPYIPAIKVNNVRQGFFERDQVEHLTARLPTEIGDVVWFAYLTSWRRSEILGLRWSHVHRAAGEIRLGDSKSGAGRVIPYRYQGRLWSSAS